MSIISGSRYNLPGEVRTHSHRHGHIILPLTGYFYISWNGQEYWLTPEQIGFVPPEVLHSYSCPGEALTLNIPSEMIKASDLVYLTENCVRAVDGHLAPLIALIRQEAADPSVGSDSLRYLFYFLYDKLVAGRESRSLRYMEENYASDLTIRELAAMENYNVSYYIEWFRKTVGCLPSEYLRRVRIGKAKEILATTKYRIIDVAMQVGYGNSSSFTRAFRESEGMTPYQYRKKEREAGKTAGDAPDLSVSVERSENL